MSRLSIFIILLISSLLFSCNKDNDAVVVPDNILVSDQGILIELEWNTGGSSNQALYDSDLDLYLDLGSEAVEASENISSFEEVLLRDIYRDGTYDIYIGAIDVSRYTDYDLYISAPGGGVIHHYTGYLERGESGEVHYLSIRKQGRHYTLLDL